MHDINKIWEELKNKINTCNKCGLCKTRHNAVPGEGNLNTKVVLIGEGPGKDEDMTGRPFIGEAGQLLTKILNAAKIDRNELFITNVIKCRTDEFNRDPMQEEMYACRDFLEAQLLIIRPSIIITAGNVPTKLLLRTNNGITSLHGKFSDWRGIKLFPIFHPSYLLHSPDKSNNVGSPRYLMWQDIKLLKQKIDEVNSQS